MPLPSSAFVALAVMATGVAGQFKGWQEDQRNTTICKWIQPRAALVRNKIYIDGGTIFWSPGLDDGQYGPAQYENNQMGVILSYDLSRPFNKDTNVTDILLEKAMSKAIGGNGNSNGAAPNFEDGGMLANDAQFYLYGGVYPRSVSYEDPDADELIGYQAYQYGPDKPAWRPGFVEKGLSEGVTRYVAYGGAVNAPSENKAWYFSGLTSRRRGPIYTISANGENSATEVSNRFIELDMHNQLFPEWKNESLPRDIPGRANPEVVWVPVGEQGILVVLGGVVFPHWVENDSKSEDPETSEKESPEFMKTIDVYDIANNKWYQQPVEEEGPGALTRGCAVVAEAPDGSSFNIYYYGGFDGISPKEDFSDAVWVLSLPSFTWTLFNEGNSLHARSGHKCFRTHSDQMMALGGYVPLVGKGNDCLDQGPVVVFNLTSGEWLESYNPMADGEYSVPEKVQSVATATTPSGGWATPALGDVFKRSYSMEKITTHWPYPSQATESTNPDLPSGGGDDDDDDGGSGLPKWVAPVLGVVLGLILVTGVVVFFCIWRRRKHPKNRPSEPGTEDTSARIITWIRGQHHAQHNPPLEKAPPTVTETEEMPASPEMGQARAVTMAHVAAVKTNYHRTYEMDNTQVIELDASPPPMELYNTGMAYSPRSFPRGQSVSPTPYRSHSSKPSSVSADDNLSDAVSQTSGPVNPHDYQHAVDSPTLASNTPEPERPTARNSDVSQMTVHPSHLRNLSDATISSEGTHVDGRPAPERLSQSDVQGFSPIAEEAESPRSRAGPIAETEVASDFATPVSPPTADETPDIDYISAKHVVSPLAVKKSVFRKDSSEEELR